MCQDFVGFPLSHSKINGVGCSFNFLGSSISYAFQQKDTHKTKLKAGLSNLCREVCKMCYELMTRRVVALPNSTNIRVNACLYFATIYFRHELMEVDLHMLKDEVAW